ncbi:fidgetin-like protein 1 [Prunus yedoensis var. nudiflora]|uniref:Fidgetin-like protein 1 n=1 Tax=Prunus yedoensis var. nudiflora TaxID=2094558 RepID=A0A314XQA1_PRUYE|nr:fidgetin-like protein 1 [Prunus yedoensis var. nudiflora]
MAGKEEAKRGGGWSEEVCWRKQVDDNLSRLHSLLFGAELAVERHDFSSAQVLGLRLLGFLDSQSHSQLDHAFVRPIRRETVSKLDAARRALIPHSDRKAFEQAKKAPGYVFGTNGDIDIEKVKQSKYFQALLHQSNNGRVVNDLGDQLERQDKLTCKLSKPLAQTKLTSLYKNNFMMESNGKSKSSWGSRSNSSDDCTIVEKLHSYHNRNGGHSSLSFQKAEEEEKAYGNTLRAKRAHKEFTSPIIDNAKSPSSNEDVKADGSSHSFVTAKAKLEMDARQRRGLAGSPNACVSPQSDNNATNKGYGMRSYGYSRRGARDDTLGDSTKKCLEMLCGPDGELPEKLRNLEPRLLEHVSNEIMDKDPNVRWNDIAGLEHAKKCVTEMVIWPLLRPDIFKGCRSPGKGLLLFGPPGTGKTMIGKAIAGEAKATFFYISASSLTSKWIVEGEKLVRALFGVASCRQPAVIFVDEIDSLLSQRKSEGEHESSRRLKTQFLIEMEGFDSGSEQILLIGATNRPQELDEAARRRLTKRLYIPLPSSEARAWIVQNILDKDGLFKLSREDIDSICNLTEVKDASMGPLREALKQGIEITKLKKEDMRAVTVEDFVSALQEVRPSVSLNELGTYEEWNKQFGSLSL